MSKSVVVVHDDMAFSEQVSAALRSAGYDVVGFSDPMATLDALERGLSADILITRTQFPSGKPNGVSLAQMARVKRRGIKILITGKPHLAEFADGVAEFHAHPVNIPRLVDAVERLLGEGDRPDPALR